VFQYDHSHHLVDGAGKSFNNNNLTQTHLYHQIKISSGRNIFWNKNLERNIQFIFRGSVLKYVLEQFLDILFHAQVEIVGRIIFSRSNRQPTIRHQPGTTVVMCSHESSRSGLGPNTHLPRLAPHLCLEVPRLSELSTPIA
jgi:hypothetical protein